MILNQSDNPTMHNRVNDPDLVHWAADSYRLGLEATNPNRIHYSIDTHEYITGQLINATAYIHFVQTVCQQQLYLAGKHSALLLNALFDPEHSPKQYVAYLKTVKNDPSIKTMKQLPPFS